MSRYKGKFIVFEGLDGSGLSTHSKLLRDWLKKKDYKVHLTAEPTDSPIGVMIRQAMIGNVNILQHPDIMGLLFAADRLQHVRGMKYGSAKAGQVGLVNALKEGYFVICNRYTLSSLAYQSISSGGEEVDVSWIKQINRFNSNHGIIIPDLTIFLDVPPQICWSRITTDRERYELYESFNDLKSVYENFKRLLRENLFPFVEISGTHKNNPRNVEKVHEDIINQVREHLLEKAAPALQRPRKAPRLNLTLETLKESEAHASEGA